MKRISEPVAINAIAGISQEEYTVTLGGFEAFTLVAGVQLCLRHPDMTPDQANILEIVGRNIQNTISSDPTSTIYQVMEMGWHREHDIGRPSQDDASAPACGGHGHTGVAINPSARMDYEDFDTDSQYDGY